jgi:hypothetical protein
MHGDFNTLDGYRGVKDFRRVKFFDKRPRKSHERRLHL